jgi:hypothetical protein
MKQVFSLFTFLLMLANVGSAYAWGVWGHNHINKGAIMALPKEMGMFFYNHADFIVQESTVPDLRKYTLGDKAEGCRHYINLEMYDYTGCSGMPISLKDAVKKYSVDSLNKYGELPWYIQEMMDLLTEAFRKKRKTEILLLAADLGHYIGDAHMPLHTTVNHNGQLTGQQGIHAFWEAQLPELFGKNYNLYVAPATCVRDIRLATWAIIDSSHRLADVLLNKELGMRTDNPIDKQYDVDASGKPVKNIFGQPKHAYEYAHVYHELLDGMVERQMRSAISYTAAFWYTAWVNAGKPDLSDLDPENVTAKSKSFYKQDMKAWRSGKVKGCASDKEFD